MLWHFEFFGASRERDGRRERERDGRREREREMEEERERDGRIAAPESQESVLG